MAKIPNKMTLNGVELTDDVLDAMAAPFESGEWPEGVTVPAGRPRVDPSDDTKIVSLRIPVRKLAAVDEKAAILDIPRSEAVREALDMWLQA